MLTKRIIACLDVKDGRTVKGKHFKTLRDMGDPVEQAAHYAGSGVDELVFLDISATAEKRKTLSNLVRAVAREISIPFTVGGGISAVADVALLLENGADKVSVNSAALRDRELVSAIARRFGSQCVVVAVDTKKVGDEWMVFSNGGSMPTGMVTRHWIREAVDEGAGEILLTSIDKDGTRSGFAVELTREISGMVNVPIIASGGAGSKEHFLEVFTLGAADAALAAGIFHEGVLDIPSLKQYLADNSIQIRL